MHIVTSAVVTLQQGSLIMITTELLHMEACPDHMTGQCRSHSGSSWRKAEWMRGRGEGGFREEQQLVGIAYPT
ncbi:unnamed protein product [Arctogadus glacialis]